MALELLRLVRRNIYTQDASLVQGYAYDMNDVVLGLIEEYIGEEKGQRKKLACHLPSSQHSPTSSYTQLSDGSK